MLTVATGLVKAGFPGAEPRFLTIVPDAPFYQVGFILCFLAMDKLSVPFSRPLGYLGRRSYGIYLLHGEAVEWVLPPMQRIWPGLAAHSNVSVLPYIAVALGVPLLFMAGIARSPARRFYRYLFG